MIGTVVYICGNAQYREASEYTCLCCFLNTFTDCGNVLFRNCTADYGRLILEGLLAVRIHRLELNFTMSVLTTSTGLLCIFVFLIDRLCKCLFVCNLRCSDVCFYLKFAEQTVNDDLKMKLAHSCDDRLSCLGIRVCTERRVFLGKLRKRLTHLALCILRLRLDRELDNGLRELHGLKDNRMLLITDRIAGRRKLKAYGSGYITGIHLIQFLSLVCMHL